MDGMVTRFELNRCQILQALVRTDVVVVAAPGIDEDACFDAAAEPFQRQAFVAELAVETLGIAVLPGFTGIDQRGVDPLLGQPVENGMADELRAVVGTQEAWCAVRGDQTREHLDTIGPENRGRS